MNFQPKISIVIPVYMGPGYKHPDYLREAVDSALGQTYRNIEVIVVNDGSDDGGKAEEIARSYGGRIRYFYKENGGVSSALNIGLKEMTGEYFSWLSHDDVYYPEKIEKEVRYLEMRGNKETLIFCDYRFIDENSGLLNIGGLNQRYLKNIYLTILSGTVDGCSLLIPKVCFEKIGLFNESLRTTQDGEMWLRIARGGFHFEYLPEILVKSRLHSDRVSNIRKKYHEQELKSYYLWAVKSLGDEVLIVFDDLCAILLRSQCDEAFNELMKLRYKNPILRRYYYLINLLRNYYGIRNIFHAAYLAVGHLRRKAGGR